MPPASNRPTYRRIMDNNLKAGHARLPRTASRVVDERRAHMLNQAANEMPELVIKQAHVVHRVKERVHPIRTAAKQRCRDCHVFDIVKFRRAG